jgi:hypothetical protein
VILNKSKVWRNQIHSLWFITIPAFVTAVAAIALMRWAIPVLVQVQLTTQRVEFVVDAAQPQGKPILNTLGVRSLGIEHFSSVVFEPETIRVADPSRYLVEGDAFPPSAWKQVSVTTPRVSFEPNDIARHPRIGVDMNNDSHGTAMRLDPIGVAAGVRVVVETRGEKNERLSITVAGQQRVNLSVRGPFALIADHTRITGVSGPTYEDDAEVTYRIRLRESAPWIEIVGRSDGLVILPVLSIERPTIPVSTDIAVATLEFMRQDPSGERVSALTGQGLITFPEYPHLGRMTIGESDGVGLERLDRFSIKELTVSPDSDGISLVGEGMVGQIRTRTGQIPIERHLTAFDALKHNSQLMALFAIIVWVVPTAIGAHKLFKDLKR